MTMNNLWVVGVNHQMAPVEVRERLALGPERLRAALAGLQRELAGGAGGARSSGGAPCDAGAAEVAILSTCNRTEVYAWAAGDAGSIIRRHLAERGGLEPQGAAATLPAAMLPAASSPEAILYARCGDEAACHLLRVAAGLDSLVIGENEILGQVKAAFELAHAAGTTGPMLSALFRYAVQAGKRVRSETEIGRAALSVATIVVEMAQETFGSLAERTALLIGAGKMSSITGQALVRAGLRCVLVANRTFDRAQRLAASLGGRAVHFDALAENLAAADIVICSTGAPHLVLHAGELRRVLEGGRAQATHGPGAETPRLLVVDLAVPRDADPAIATLPGVRLADIDDLEALVQANHPLAVAVRQAAEDIVREELNGYRAWQEARCCVPVIQALRERAEMICEAEVTKTLRRMGELSPQQQAAVGAMARAIANKLLHDPIVNLKEPPDGAAPDDYAELTGRLFGLN